MLPGDSLSDNEIRAPNVTIVWMTLSEHLYGYDWLIFTSAWRSALFRRLWAREHSSDLDELSARSAKRLRRNCATYGSCGCNQEEFGGVFARKICWREEALAHLAVLIPYPWRVVICPEHSNIIGPRVDVVLPIVPRFPKTSIADIARCFRAAAAA